MQENEEKSLPENEEERDYRAAILSIIRGDCDDKLLKELLSDYHENDIASALDELSPQERERVIGALGSDAISDILPFIFPRWTRMMPPR